MGMTIDEAVRHLDTYSSTMGSGQTTQEQHEDAKGVAISTMRKYQKIEEIVKFGNANELGFEYVGEKITEVLEDGNV